MYSPPPNPGYPQSSPQDYGPAGASDDHMWALLSYLLALIASILAPLVIYLVKMNESRYVRFHAAQALNLGITGLIYAFAILIVGILIAIPTHGLGIVLMVLAFLALGVIHLIFLILGAVRASRGERYQMPALICLPMVK